ncbi:DoxX family protein [Bradyrhizobium sp. USDA 3262]
MDTAIDGLINLKVQRLIGWIFTVLISALLGFSSVIKLVAVPEVRQTLSGLGWPAHLDFTVGVIELICLALFLLPRTAVLGAVLETALLGATVALKLRVGDPMITHVLFGVYMGFFVWGALYFREPRVRQLMPWRGLP